MSAYAPTDETRIREAKRPVLTTLAHTLRGQTWEGCEFKVRRNADAVRAETRLPDGTFAIWFIATYKVGLPPGQFALAPMALMRGGPIWQVLRNAGALHSDDSWLVRLNLTLLPHHQDWVPADDLGISTCTGFLRDTAPKVLSMFIHDWSAAMTFVDSTPNQVTRADLTLTTLRMLREDSSPDGQRAAERAVAAIID